MDEPISNFSSSMVNRAAISCMHPVFVVVLLAQYRLVELDHVLHVMHLYVRQQLLEGSVGYPLQPTVGHCLDHHDPGEEEHYFG
jgi:hypothetical protein